MRAAAPATSTAAVKPAQRQGPGCPTGPKRITAAAVNRIAAAVSAVVLAPIRCGSPRIPVATSSPRSGSTLARWAATPSNPPAVSAQAAHLANVLPDLGDDVATGIRGLPHRIGARALSLIHI